MGRTYLFECPRCGYHARVSGGTDRGEHFAVRTIACSDCKQLFDAVTEFKAHKSGSDLKVAPPFAAAFNRLPPRKIKERQKFKPACPVSPAHHVGAWNWPGKCPKCSMYMERDGLPFRVWD